MAFTARIVFFSFFTAFVGELFCQVDWKERAPLFKGQELDESRVLETIAFGSCNHQDLDQSIWTAVLAHHPDLWIWGGDNVYADTEDMAFLYEKYFKQKHGKGYKELRQEAMVLGTWDDHDYGVNDGNKGYRWKRESKEILMDFLDVPENSVVRRRDGVYQSWTFGPESRQVKIILLDTRWFQDFLRPDTTGNKGYLPNDAGDILGEVQWKWLENELTESKANIHLIVSSFQVIPDRHRKAKWGYFPQARKRFFELIKRTQPANTLILSGDRHLAELSRLDLTDSPSPLFELTSSGMTHTAGTRNPNIIHEKNPYRVGPQLVEKNFAVLTIDWSADKPSVNASVYSQQNELLFSFELPFFRD